MVFRVVADLASRRPERIEVVDTGVGIPPDRQEAIFEALRAGGWQYRTAVRRYRLGLAASKSLCDLLGYQLLVESEPSAGSLFRVILTSDCAARSDRKAGVSFATLRPSLDRG